MMSFPRTLNWSSRIRSWLPRCSNADCCRQSFFRSVARAGTGIRVAENWYCCAECFEYAMEMAIRKICATPARPAQAKKARIPLGLLLHSRGVLTKEQLQRVLEFQRGAGINFGEAAQTLGFATAEQITAAVAAQWGCPVFPLGGNPMAEQVRIPKCLLELYRMLPVHFSQNGRKLLIACVESVQYHALYTIEHMTGCIVQPCFITAREYERHLQSWSSLSPREDDLLFEHMADSHEMARITCNYVVQSGAAEARIGKCRNFLWARIWGPRKEMDLLFRIRND